MALCCLEHTARGQTKVFEEDGIDLIYTVCTLWPCV
jgi:hypothetical protein